MLELDLQWALAHRTKTAARGFKCVCPSCGGNDVWVTPHTLLGHCFECGASYRMVEEGKERAVSHTTRVLPPFDTTSIRRLYNELAEYYHSCIELDHRMYLYSRGLTDAAISTFKIGYCPPDHLSIYTSRLSRDAGVASYGSEPWLANRIVFPYIAEYEITDMRGRVLGDDPMRYKSLYHRPERRGAVFPFNHDRAYKRSTETGTLVITEGELKAIVADMYGFAVMALPGILSYRSIIVPPKVKLVVVFDSDSKQESNVRVDRAIARLADRVPPFSVGTLSLFGETKMDIDSFLTHPKGGPDMFQYIVDHALPYKDYRSYRRF